MITNFLDSVSGGVASSWLTLIRAPAVMFWTVGALACWYAHPKADVISWLHKLSGTEQILLIVVAAAALIGSSALLDQLARPLLRALEGYWPRSLDPFREKLIARHISRQRSLQEEWDDLDGAEEDETAPGTAPAASTVAAAAMRDQRRVRIDIQLHGYAADETRVMPTRLGNILRASETYSTERYGLDAIITWPRLWLLLPAETKDEIASSQRSLDQSVAVLVALGATLVWLFWAWWVVLIAILVPPLMYRAFVIPRAQALAEIVTAAFDLNRTALYRALRFPLPHDADDEVGLGTAVTQYLWRGFPPAGLSFDAEQPTSGDAE